MKLRFIVLLFKKSIKGEVSPSLQPRYAGFPLPPLRGTPPQRPRHIGALPVEALYHASIRTHEAELIMKGVVVQVGKPKSIVLFNNGKIGAIPTPADCHVGMVVTVKYNNKLKILAITFAAVLLLGAGIFIPLG